MHKKGITHLIATMVVLAVTQTSFTQPPDASQSLSNQLPPSISVSGDFDVETFHRGADLFTNRNYSVAECPAWLEGLHFLRSSIDVTEFHVVEAGHLIALTPASNQMRSSQSAALQSLGFKRIEQQSEPFQLFGQHDWDRVWAYHKTVKAGEHYRFGKWIVLLGFQDATQREPVSWDRNTGELLYNGIRLPEEWPPRQIDFTDDAPMPVPYLDYPPDVIPIDIGRQLFFDDFLIEQSDLSRTFHQPVKYTNNPVLKPETELEINAIRRGPSRPGEPGNAAAVPKSGGVWWDPGDEMFKMWYEAGWIGTIAYAVSKDGLEWIRPELEIVPGTNQVLPPDHPRPPDSWTVVPDWQSNDAEAQWTLFMMPPTQGGPGWSFTSPDGIHWNRQTRTGNTGDRSTHFYNPFRQKWVYSLRAWPNSEVKRSRAYYECDDFMADAQWRGEDTVLWLKTDRNDPVDYLTRQKPQLYNFDAVAYESIMLGMFQLHHGPPNQDCAEAGLPKITELMFAYSRDGFHFGRPDRRAHIPAERSDVWDRGYVQSIGNVCTVVGDQLWFYYTGFQGDTSKAANHWFSNGMYDRGATGIAYLRRDGFASMDADENTGSLLTRPVTFSGRHLFVNADVTDGRLRAEVRDIDGRPIPPFTLENSRDFTGDSTLQPLRWKDGTNLSALVGRPVRFYFELTDGSLYAFWVSKDQTGRSDGYVAGGGPGYTGPTDTVGRAAIEKNHNVLIER